VAEPPSHVTLTIDGRPVTVPRGTTVWQAARQLGIDIPIFCYHDRMPPLGACRQCIVRLEKNPRWQTSCTLLAEEGMAVQATAADVRAAQERNLEFLLINHPLDCPICDKGGECPLQDQTFAYGPGRSRFVERKRDFAKPVSLGPLLMLDRERCILCWRCVRFGEIVAGDDALKGFERGFQSEINTPFTQPVRSKFIGNTMTICPVGALTSRPYRFLARPWDNNPVSSVCNHCGLGCAVWLDVRDQTIARVRPREMGDLNDIWLCDLGQFGFEWIHARDRLTRPLVRRQGALVEASWDEALDLVAARLQESKDRGRGRTAALGGSRLTNEDNFLVRRLFREVVGTPHLDHRTDAPPGSASLEVRWGLRSALAEIEQSEIILLVGCDITEEYPIAWLRMKQAVDRGAHLYALHPKRLEVHRFLTAGLVHAPGAAARVLAQIADAVGGRKTDGRALQAAGVDPQVVATLAERLRTAARPMVFIGRSALEGAAGGGVLRAAQRLQAGGCTIHIMRGRGNAVGAALMDVLPGPDGWTAPEIIRRAGEGALDVLYVLGADPAVDTPDRDAWARARARTPFLVVHDLFLTPTARQADVVLPALAYAEKHGTVCNLEGRVQAIEAAVRGPGEARSDSQILIALAARLGAEWTYGGWEEVFAAARAAVPGLEVGAILSPPPLAGEWPADGAAPSAGQGLVLIAGDVLFDRGSMTGRSPAIADLAGPPSIWVHPADAAAAGVAEGALTEVAADGARLVLRARLTEEVPPGRVFVPRGYDAAPLQRLLSWDRPLVMVSLQPVDAAGAEPEEAP
jgi:NADH-quinone oxidoreductase subunit G